MAPAIKELSRWLDANTEYCVAPDWADVVKHSGFLPEGKFTRILTEPVTWYVIFYCTIKDDFQLSSSEGVFISQHTASSS
ncbi:unnamed protein product [Oncorhynchus mykiss]|uniref:Uncharacterized protein n=1 Tax=Oncorhynchus mykiss TaxID=8022 RepID=A0A060WZC1_ONCMY|nr:unnamed protein product [Oncorhynchus mykiss]